MDNDQPPDKNELADTDFEVVERKKFTAHDEDFSGANDEARTILLASLEEEHRDLDAAILAIEQTQPYERLLIARLKKKKLQLKDRIGKLKDDLFPDIIA